MALKLSVEVFPGPTPRAKPDFRSLYGTFPVEEGANVLNSTSEGHKRTSSLDAVNETYVVTIGKGTGHVALRVSARARTSLSRRDVSDTTDVARESALTTRLSRAPKTSKARHGVMASLQALQD